MPTYEYICAKCDHQFEKFQSMNDPALKICPKELCARKAWGKGKVKRAITSGAGLIFKGSGFYITDYRSEGYKAAAKNDVVPTTPATVASAGDTKTPAKPAPKAAESKPAKSKSKES